MLAVAAVALLAPGTAMGSACGDDVLSDWADNGRIDRVYEIECYSEAIDSIPPDIRDYANAEEVIARALQRRSNPDDDDRSAALGTPAVDTSDPSAIPIPLLLLAAMAILLLGAGGLGYVSRRRNEAAADVPSDDEIQG